MDSYELFRDYFGTAYAFKLLSVQLGVISACFIPFECRDVICNLPEFRPSLTQIGFVIFSGKCVVFNRLFTSDVKQSLAFIDPLFELPRPPLTFKVSFIVLGEDAFTAPYYSEFITGGRLLTGHPKLTEKFQRFNTLAGELGIALSVKVSLCSNSTLLSERVTYAKDISSFVEYVKPSLTDFLLREAAYKVSFLNVYSQVKE